MCPARRRVECLCWYGKERRGRFASEVPPRDRRRIRCEQADTRQHEDDGDGSRSRIANRSIPLSASSCWGFRQKCIQLSARRLSALQRHMRPAPSWTRSFGTSGAACRAPVGAQSNSPQSTWLASPRPLSQGRASLLTWHVGPSAGLAVSSKDRSSRPRPVRCYTPRAATRCKGARSARLSPTSHLEQCT